MYTFIISCYFEQNSQITGWWQCCMAAPSAGCWVWSVFCALLCSLWCLVVKCGLSREGRKICSFFKAIFHLLHLPDTPEIWVGFQYFCLNWSVCEHRSAKQQWSWMRSFCVCQQLFLEFLELGSGSLLILVPSVPVDSLCLLTEVHSYHKRCFQPCHTWS